MVLADLFLYIAIIIAFFLLGLIIGYVLNPRRKLRKNKEKPLAETSTISPIETGSFGQDINRYDAESRRQQQREQREQREQRYRSNSYDNSYNNYYDSPWSNFPPRNDPKQRR